MKKNLKKIGLLLAGTMLTATIFAGCGKGSGSETQTASKDTFVIAYAPNESTDESADAREGLAKDLEKELGVKVEEIQASDYNAIVEALRTGKADPAYIGSLAIAYANDRAGAIPVAMKAPDGDKSMAVYHSLLITSSKNDDINSIEDIKGKSIAFVDPESTSGNLFPSYDIIKAFPDENLTSDDLHTNGKFFSATSYSGKHQAGLQAVIKGDVDVVPISDQILESEFENGNANKDDVKIIHTSDDIPAEGFVVGKDVDKNLRDKFQKFLIYYDNEDYFDKVIKVPNARFVEASIDDYQIVIDLKKTMNTEL